MHLLLGIDDTDVLGHSIGTGRLARELGAHLEEQGLAQLVGVIRHQLLVDPRIPYTSHNSPACLILKARPDGNGLAGRILGEASDYVTARSAQGSDPGVCLVEKRGVAAAVVRFGRRAGSEVLSKADALDLAARQGIPLKELGGTGDGVIGALAAVGLTYEGNAGRFLDFSGGLRGLGERVRAGALMRRGIRLMSVSRNGEAVPAEVFIATGDWVRPRLIAGRPVLLVEQAEGGWRCFDRKKQKAA
jgi:pimeloyl-ACP methyl ester carboxylesterase